MHGVIRSLTPYWVLLTSLVFTGVASYEARQSALIQMRSGLLSELTLKEQYPAVLILFFGVTASLVLFALVLKSEREFRKLEDELKQAHRTIQSQQAVMAKASHDLRNPLTAILMASSLIQRLVSRIPQGAPDLAIIQRQAENLTQTIKKMNGLIDHLSEAAPAQELRPVERRGFFKTMISP